MSKPEATRDQMIDIFVDLVEANDLQSSRVHQAEIGEEAHETIDSELMRVGIPWDYMTCYQLTWGKDKTPFVVAYGRGDERNADSVTYIVQGSWLVARQEP